MSPAGQYRTVPSSASAATLWAEHTLPSPMYRRPGLADGTPALSRTTLAMEPRIPTGPTQHPPRHWGGRAPTVRAGAARWRSGAPRSPPDRGPGRASGICGSRRAGPPAGSPHAESEACHAVPPAPIIDALEQHFAPPAQSNRARAGRRSPVVVPAVLRRQEASVLAMKVVAI